MFSSSPRRHRIMTAALFAGGLATTQLAFGAPAHATNSVVFSEDFLTVRYDSFGPTANNLTLVQGDGFFRLTDTAETIHAGEGCWYPGDDQHIVECVGTAAMVNLWGGNDRLDASETQRPLTADLGSGDDVAIGSPAGDWITGGPGKDVLFGAGGNDYLEARDDVGGDRVDGGEGADGCGTDRGDIRISCS